SSRRRFPERPIASALRSKRIAGAAKKRHALSASLAPRFGGRCTSSGSSESGSRGQAAGSREEGPAACWLIYRVTDTVVVALAAVPVSSAPSATTSALTPPKRRSSVTSLRGRNE